jgi:hypothetical protein
LRVVVLFCSLGVLFDNLAVFVHRPPIVVVFSKQNSNINLTQIFSIFSIFKRPNAPDGIYDFNEGFKCVFKDQKQVSNGANDDQLWLWKQQVHGGPAPAGGTSSLSVTKQTIPATPCWHGTATKELTDPQQCGLFLQAPERCFALALADPRCSRAGLTEITMHGYGTTGAATTAKDFECYCPTDGPQYTDYTTAMWPTDVNPTGNFVCSSGSNGVGSPIDTDNDGVPDYLDLDGFYVDNGVVPGVVLECASVSDSSARTCTGAGASGIQSVTCDPGFHESGSAGVDLGCTACATVLDASARTCDAGGANGIQTVACDTGFHESGSAGNDLGCTACANQANCAANTANQCSTSSGFTTKTPCASVTAAGYYLDGDVVKVCASVSDASARTCTAGGASGIQTVACDTGFHESGSAGNDLGCAACANQANCAASTSSACSTTAGITTKTPCTSVTAPGYYLDGDKVGTCATIVDASATTCNGAGAGDIQTVTCDPGFIKIGSAGNNNLACVADTDNTVQNIDGNNDGTDDDDNNNNNNIGGGDSG